MNFLDKLVLPQSEHHLILMQYLMIITYMLFLPYISILTGSLFLSIIYRKLGISGDEKYLRFSKQFIDLVTFNKSLAFGLGIVPFLSLIFSYTQQLHLSGADSATYLLLSLALFIGGVISVYSYKHSVHLSDILAANNDTEDAENYYKKSLNTSNRAGKLAILFLLLSNYIFFGAIQYSADSTIWNSGFFYGVLLNLSGIVSFLQFIILAFAGTYAFYIFMYKDKILSDEYEGKELIQKAIKSGLVFLILLPIFIVLSLLVNPTQSLSTYSFLSAMAAILSILLIGNGFYSMVKSGSVSSISSLIFIFLLVFTLLIVKEQSAFNTGTKAQFAQLNKNYVVYETNLKKDLGLISDASSGVDIYNGRCIACHKFDVKLVGPPYKDVLPKYKDNFDGLVTFILNPVKVNPEFPPMPNQGLKPNEAKAVAEYIISIAAEK